MIFKSKGKGNNLNNFVTKTAAKWKERAKDDRSNREQIKIEQTKILSQLEKEELITKNK